MGTKATHLTAVEVALKGMPATGDTARAAAQQAGQAGSTPYQANLACVYVERALLRALERALGGK